MSTLDAQAQYLQWTRFSELSSTMIIIYDFLITIRLEHQLIWGSRISLGKYAFLFIRYYTLLVAAFNTYVLFNPNPTIRICQIWVQWQSVTGLILFMCTEIILQVRLWAMYHPSVWILPALLVFFIPCTLFAVAVLIMEDISIKVVVTSYGASLGNACNVEKVSKIYYLYWIPFIFFEAFLFTLALWKWKSIHRLARKELLPNVQSIALVLFRDSIVYFFVIFATYLVNAAMAFIGIKHQGFIQLSIGFSVAMSSVMSQRILFNIHECITSRQALLQDSFSLPRLAPIFYPEDSSIGEAEAEDDQTPFDTHRFDSEVRLRQDHDQSRVYNDPMVCVEDVQLQARRYPKNLRSVGGTSQNILNARSETFEV